MDEAEALCDRVAIMDRGRILQLDSPPALVRGLDAPVPWLQVVSGLMPLRHLDDGMLVGFAAVVTLVAARLFRWEAH